MDYFQKQWYADQIEFTGYVDRDNVRKLLSRVDVYCMPSISEPFGLTALEAAQFGVPVVISSQSGVSEVLQSALRAEPWNTIKFSKHILHVLKNSALADRIATRSQAHLKKYTWAYAARKVIKVYDHFMN